ncbi:energy-coupling factor transporter ATPase [Heliobacterium chlorum]|uniref:Energy-coupling factor transporter ATP-binding protein EcfA2 n=1 Tax=Heliobacterium chlorum TaxID=2698 RepID=A0ABR7T3C9_HELCL|nr:energy-coupling factor transporter ATPase [Heliobacterium chlorum]MBC9785285.1 energy-coupling factor transporter ATPase [Heliobacterium chlorum]
MPIEIAKLNYVYKRDTPLASQALFNMDLQIADGELVGIIGRTGSGKSTLIQHLNGLLAPTSGTVIVDEIVVQGTSAGKANRDVRSKFQILRERVGIVFQYPEHQLFEETVYDDIAYGPRNLGLTATETKERVLQAMDMVGIDAEKIAQRSPLHLSGGQKRRVALAGVLAMRPRKLILDEPTAGLDPRGREQLLKLLQRLHREWNLTIVMVSHHMDEVARMASRLVLLDRGKVALQGRPEEVFVQTEKIAQLGMDIPFCVKLMHRLKELGWPVNSGIFENEAVVEEILRVVQASKDNEWVRHSRNGPEGRASC